MRFLEASHAVEIMREAGPTGLHVQELAARIDCNPNKLGSFPDVGFGYMRLISVNNKDTSSDY